MFIVSSLREFVKNVFHNHIVLKCIKDHFSYTKKFLVRQLSDLKLYWLQCFVVCNTQKVSFQLKLKLFTNLIQLSFVVCISRLLYLFVYLLLHFTTSCFREKERKGKKEIKLSINLLFQCGIFGLVLLINTTAQIIAQIYLFYTNIFEA